MPVTYYVALLFVREEEGELVLGEAQDRQSAFAAESLARKLALTAASAVAFSRTGEPATGNFAMPSCSAPLARCRAWRTFCGSADTMPRELCSKAVVPVSAFRREGIGGTMKIAAISIAAALVACGGLAHAADER